MNPISSPGKVEAIAPPIAAVVTPESASWTRLLLAVLLNQLPGLLMANTALPLPVRRVSAIVCGLVLLLIGPYVVAQSLTCWARHGVILAG